MFDPTKQYTDFERYEDESQADDIKAQMIPKMEEVVPLEYRDRVKWIKQHWPEEQYRVKDDNYKTFGLTKNEIGTFFTNLEHWTLAWKTKPIGRK